MKMLINLMIFSLISIRIYSQSTGNTISGTIKDTGNEVLPGATVRLIRSGDSTLVKGEITDVHGKFKFAGLEYATYQLDITAMGQKRFTSVSLTVDEMHNTISLPAIILLPAKSIELTEVVVKARKPLIVQEIDKTVVNVESMISSATSNTLEVLEKTPGVSVSSTGEVSLNGKGGVMVLIDGRSTYMSGQDLAAYLKSLPGGLLEKIELIDNPSAKYDAAGNAVINIILKKNRAAGLTGSVSAGFSQGKYARSNDAFNLNYNRKKVNLFVNLGYGYEKNYSVDHYNRRLYSASSELTSTLDLVNDQVYHNKSINAGIGLDFTATAKTTYGLIVNLNKVDKNGLFEYDSKQYDFNHLLDITASGNTRGGESRNNSGFNVNMLHKFNSSGRELSADANFLHYLSNGNQSLQNLTFLPNGNLLDKTDFVYLIPSDIHIYTAKADYVHPLKNKARLEAGIKSSRIDNDNVFNYYDLNEGVQTIDNARSNHFKYHENISAAYVNGQKAWKRFGAQLGVRVENTRARGNQLGNDEVEGSGFSKNYTGIFPSAFVNYKLDGKGSNSLTLIALRRISRPNYQLLNPFVFLRDRYTYSSGNPLLNPQYQNRLELKYQHKKFLNMGLSYNKFTSSIFPTTQATDSIFLNRPENIAGGFMVLLNTSVSVSPAKWWYLNTTLRLSRMRLMGKVYTENLDFRTNVARLEMNNYFTMGKNWNAELGGYYASRDLNGQTVTSGMYRVNASIQKTILNGKGSIRLSVDDMFHTWVYHNKSISLRQSEYFQTSRTDTQRIGFAFTYRFGKDTFARKRKYSNSGSDEEKERL